MKVKREKTSQREMLAHRCTHTQETKGEMKPKGETETKVTDPHGWLHRNIHKAAN